MDRRIPPVLLATLMVTIACSSGGKTPEAVESPSVSGPQTYQVTMDGDSAAEDNFVFGTYFPGTIRVRPGDTLVVENRSSNDIHTVTLGIRTDRSNSPKPETKTVQANPVVFGPCFTDSEPNPDWETCPGAATSSGQAPAPAPPFSGKGYWNAGVVLPPLLAGDKAPTAATVKLGDSIPAGSYALVCVLHPFMNGEVEVVGGDADRLSPAAVAEAGEKEFKKAQAQATALKKPAVDVPGATSVIAGWGDQLIAANVFGPSTASVKVGDTVTWTSKSPYMPHTVSFAPPFAGPGDPNAFLPAGAASGSAYEGGVAHSGMIGPAPALPKDSFSLRFIKPGTYNYTCILHPRMAGTVEVQAS
jgi:plastocyanin